MSRSIGFAIVSAMVVAGVASAAPRAASTKALAGAASAKASASQATKPSSSMKSSKPANDSHSLKGTLEKFDASSRMLTVHTSKGAETLALGPNAHIMQGSKTMTADDLASHTGSKVDVKYTESNGQKTAQNVRLTAQASGKMKKPSRYE
jgi:hypothetical protein